MAAVLVVLALVASAVLGHVLMSRAPASPWTALVLIGPMAMVTIVWLWRVGHRMSGIALTVAVGVLGWAILERRVSTQGLYLVQHAGIHAALAGWFWATLRGTPLIVQVARRVHALSPAMEAYATKVTGAWVVYFVAMAVMSILLFVQAPFETWSAFATLFTPASVVAMFAGEHWLRYRLHPEFERVTMRRALRAWREGPQQASDA